MYKKPELLRNLSKRKAKIQSFEDFSDVQMTTILLAFVFFLGVLLRMTCLATIPNGFYCDEASVGYDAYSIIKTSHDRFGAFLPLFARSIGDYREAFYIYLTVPFISIFGLNEFSIRLPIACIGTLTILVIYLLTRELFDRRRALIASFLFAISPWHVQFSRMVWPHILTIFFFCSALFCLLIAIKRRPNYIYLSCVLFLLSLWTYQSARVFVPLFIMGAALIFFQELRKIGRQVIPTAIIFCIFLALFILFWLSTKGMERAKVEMHISFMKNLTWYLSYFSPSFLFIKGDPNLRHHILHCGQLYFFEAITVPVGIVWTLLNIKKKECQIVLLWLFLFPIPAAFTASYHALRSLMGAPIFSILSAVGIVTLASFIRSRKMIFWAVASLIIIINFSVCYKNYFLDYPKYSTPYWNYGMKEVFDYTEKSPYEQVIISDQFRQVHIFVLFYTHFPPSECQRLLSKGASQFFGKYHICSIEDELNTKGRVLFVVTPKEAKDLLKKGRVNNICHVIKDPSGNEEIVIAELKH